MDGEQIRFGKRIVNPKELGEIVDSAVGAVQGKSGLLLETSSRIHADGDTGTIVLAFRRSLDVLEITHSPSQELPVISYGFQRNGKP